MSNGENYEPPPVPGGAGSSGGGSESGLQEQISTIKREVDAIQINLMKGSQPWYRKPSIIISVVALLFSFGTTAVSYRKAQEEEVRAAREELRSILQRLGGLPIENFRLMADYNDDPQEIVMASLASGSLNQENSLLAAQAVEIIEAYRDEISTSEFYAAGTALRTTNITSEKAAEYLAIAAEDTDDPNVKIPALRFLGEWHLLKGDEEAGRDYYQQALDCRSEFGDIPDSLWEMWSVLTLSAWAVAEASVGNQNEAQKYLQQAWTRMQDLPIGMQQQLTSQLSLAGQTVDGSLPTGQLTTPSL